MAVTITQIVMFIVGIIAAGIILTFVSNHINETPQQNIPSQTYQQHPAQPGKVTCNDPRDNATVCSQKAACNTVLDSCGVARTCGDCTGYSHCVNNKCVCYDSRSDGEICDTAICGTKPDVCGKQRPCGTCAGTYNKCVDYACVCLDERTDPVVCALTQSNCDSVKDGCNRDRQCGTCTGPYLNYCEATKCVCKDPRTQTQICAGKCRTKDSCNRDVDCPSCPHGQTCSSWDGICYAD